MCYTPFCVYTHKHILHSTHKEIEVQKVKQFVQGHTDNR